MQLFVFYQFIYSILMRHLKGFIARNEEEVCPQMFIKIWMNIGNYISTTYNEYPPMWRHASEVQKKIFQPLK